MAPIRGLPIAWLRPRAARPQASSRRTLRHLHSRANTATVPMAPATSQKSVDAPAPLAAANSRKADDAMVPLTTATSRKTDDGAMPVANRKTAELPVAPVSGRKTVAEVASEEAIADKAAGTNIKAVGFNRKTTGLNRKDFTDSI